MLETLEPDFKCDVSNAFILAHPEIDWPARFIEQRNGTTAEFLELYKKPVNAMCNDFVSFEYAVTKYSHTAFFFEGLYSRRALTPEEYESLSDEDRDAYPLTLTSEDENRLVTWSKKSFTLDFFDRHPEISLQRTERVKIMNSEDIDDKTLKRMYEYIFKTPKHLDLALRICLKDPTNGHYVEALARNNALTVEHIIETPQLEWEQEAGELIHHDNLIPDLIYIYPNWDWAYAIRERMKIDEIGKWDMDIDNICPLKFEYGIIFMYDTLSLFDRNLANVFP